MDAKLCHYHTSLFCTWASSLCGFRVLVAQRLTAIRNRKISGRSFFVVRRLVALSLYALAGYAVLIFMLFMLRLPASTWKSNPPVAEWRGFSGHWMVFYSVALAILYSAARIVDMRLHCVNGHLVSYQAECCVSAASP